MNKFTLKLPPSKNKWLKLGRGHIYTSKEFKDWLELNYWELISQNLKAKDFTEKKTVIECYWFKKKVNEDVHNFHVALADLIKEVIKIDDCYFLIRDMDYRIDKEKPRLEFLIYQL